MKNLRKCWGFVKIDFLDRNLTFRIVWTKIVFHFDSKIYIRNHVILVRTTIRNPPECGNLSGPGLFKQWIRTFKFPDFTAILSAVTIIVLEIVIRGFSLNINYKVLKNETFGYAKYSEITIITFRSLILTHGVVTLRNLVKMDMIIFRLNKIWRFLQETSFLYRYVIYI